MPTGIRARAAAGYFLVASAGCDVEEHGVVLSGVDALASYPAPVAATDPVLLSRREQDVLGALQQGLTNREIAHRLFISTNTVNKHVQQVLRKLQVRNRVQAAIHARGLAG